MPTAYPTAIHKVSCYMNILNKLTILLLAGFPVHLFANECNEKQAMDIAILEINKNFPGIAFDSEQYSVYSDISDKENWVVSIQISSTSEGNSTRGGGLPVVTIKKTNCEVLNVYLSR